MRKRERKPIGKRLLSLFLAFAMVLTSVVVTPMTAKADEGQYNGPTVSDDGVTFYYYDSNYGTESALSQVWMKGSWDDSWGAHIPLVHNGNGTWSVTVPFSGADVNGVAAKYGSSTPGVASGDTTVTFDRGKTYVYGFEDNLGGTWLSSDGVNNPKVGGDSEVVCGPSVTADGIKLYYYPAHGSYPTITVKYRTVGSTTDWSSCASVTMEKDTTYTAILSASLTGLSSGSYEYKLYNVDTEVSDHLNPDQTFTLGNIPREDPSVQSPVIGVLPYQMFQRAHMHMDLP